jgi:hypothetical protein
MKHLIDEREPITVADIDQAIKDGAELLAAFSEHGAAGVSPDDTFDALERLHAIALDAYGFDEANAHD